MIKYKNLKVLTTLVISSLFILSISSCCDDDDHLEDFCFAFDVRACETDLYADEVNVDGTKTERELAMIDWLESKGFSVQDIDLNIQVLDALCEACHVCPMGDSYSITVKNEVTVARAQELQLLNFVTFECR